MVPHANSKAGNRSLPTLGDLRGLVRLLTSNSIGTGLGVAAQLVAIPVQLAGLGASWFGLLALFLSIVSAGSIADTGVAQTTMRFVARGSRFPRLVEHVLASGITVILAIGLGLLVLTEAVALAVYLIDGEGLLAGVSLPAFAALASSGLAFGMLATLALNTLRGLRLYGLFAFCESAYRVVVPLVLAMVAWASHDILLVLLAFCITTAVSAVTILLAISVCARVRLRLTVDLRYFRRRMFSFSKWVWLQSVFGYLGTQADRFIVAGFASMSALGYYSIAASVASGLVALASAGGGFLLPEASTRLNRPDWLRDTFRKSTFALSTSTSIAVLVALPLLPLLLPVWLGSQSSLQLVWYLIPLLWVAASTVTSVPATQFMNAMGHQRLAATLGIFNNLVTILALFVGGWSFGVIGVVVARLLVLPQGLVSRAIVIDRVFAMPSPVRTALALTWPIFVGATLGLGGLLYVLG